MPSRVTSTGWWKITASLSFHTADSSCWAADCQLSWLARAARFGLLPSTSGFSRTSASSGNRDLNCSNSLSLTSVELSLSSVNCSLKVNRGSSSLGALGFFLPPSMDLTSLWMLLSETSCPDLECGTG